MRQLRTLKNEKQYFFRAKIYRYYSLYFPIQPNWLLLKQILILVKSSSQILLRVCPGRAGMNNSRASE